jgi:hypothetical protein
MNTDPHSKRRPSPLSFRRDGLWRALALLGGAACCFCVAPARAQGSAARVSSGQQASVESASPDAASQQLVDSIVSLLNDAVITQLDAKVSLEGVDVQSGRVRLRGVLLRDLKIGFRLNARGTRKLIEALAARPSPRERELAGLLGIVKLGLFNKLEVALRLDALCVRELSLDAKALKVEELHVWAQAQAGSKSIIERGAPSADLLLKVAALLSRTSINSISTGLSLRDLDAQRLRVQLSGVALDRLFVGLTLGRAD